ncbi:hypothetical protein GH733_015161, partial [Mirounga leonina]
MTCITANESYTLKKSRRASEDILVWQQDRALPQSLRNLEALGDTEDDRTLEGTSDASTFAALPYGAMLLTLLVTGTPSWLPDFQQSSPSPDSVGTSCSLAKAVIEQESEEGSEHRVSGRLCDLRRPPPQHILAFLAQSHLRHGNSRSHTLGSVLGKLSFAIRNSPSYKMTAKHTRSPWMRCSQNDVSSGQQQEAFLSWQVAMASGPTMTAPICLVENNNMHLSVNQTAIQILERISQPVVVVAIIGLYRAGKSYLMNHLAGQNRGFPLGSAKGIWMWCMPHPCKPNHTLVLLDTEGLGDVEKGDPKNNSWIFALTVLLSSTFIYNSLGTINHQALEQLQYPSRDQATIYVTELTKLIRAKSSPEEDGTEDSTEFVSFFPDFIWAVRDLTLELKLNGHPITEDEYLENALKLTAGLWWSYMDTINTGSVPCLENAVTTLAELENSVAVQKAADHYSEQMAQRVKLPTDKLQELLDVHADCEREATAVFMEHSFKDDQREFQKKLVELIKDKKEHFLQQNEEASIEYCQSRLDQLSQVLMESISAGTFSVPGGHELYREAKESIEWNYSQVPRKGVKANEVLQSFLQSQASIEESIWQADKALTDREKAIAAEQVSKESAETEQELLRQKLLEQQQQMGGTRKDSPGKHSPTEREDGEGERKHTKRTEHDVQHNPLNERFSKKYEEMNEEIKQLKYRVDATKNNDTPWFAQVLEDLAMKLFQYFLLLLEHLIICM